MYKRVIILLLFCSLAVYGQTKKITLNEAIETSLKNNSQVLTAQKEIHAADGRILQAGRIPNAEFSIESNEIPKSFSFGNAGEHDFNFSQPLEFFGKRSARIQSAGYEKQAAELNLERIKKLVTAQVKSAYYQGLPFLKENDRALKV